MQKPKRFHVILAAAILLVGVTGAFAVNWYTNQNRYGAGSVDMEVTFDKPFYLQNENVTISIYVINPQDWPVPKPNFLGYAIQKDGIGYDGYGLHINFASDHIPTFPPHTTTLYTTIEWDQKTGMASNRTLVEPGNYSLTVTLSGYGYDVDSGNLTIQIRPIP
jgi:hypothetical protein